MSVHKNYSYIIKRLIVFDKLVTGINYTERMKLKYNIENCLLEKKKKNKIKICFLKNLLWYMWFSLFPFFCTNIFYSLFLNHISFHLYNNNNKNISFIYKQ